MNSEEFRPTCFYCGQPLGWDNNEMLGDRYDDVAPDDERIISYYHCSNCGHSYEVFSPNQEEKETDYKEFWQNGRE